MNFLLLYFFQNDICTTFTDWLISEGTFISPLYSLNSIWTDEYVPHLLNNIALDDIVFSIIMIFLYFRAISCSGSVMSVFFIIFYLSK